MSNAASICVTVMAHNEEARIARCLNSLPLDDAGVVFHVVVNGTTDGTAAIARQIAVGRANVFVHDYKEGGKSRSWNRFVLDELPDYYDVHVFADGDGQILAGSVNALADALRADAHLNAVSALPRNGRGVEFYRQAIRDEHGLVGDLYAVRGDFLRRMKAANIRLPEDLIGDDGLIGALAKTDLQGEGHYDPERLIPCEDAGYLCDPISLWQPASWRLQYRRMINYSVRHFQNGLITDVMRGPGPSALPQRLALLYPETLSKMRPRNRFPEYWFDRLALKRMAAAI